MKENKTKKIITKPVAAFTMIVILLILLVGLIVLKLDLHILLIIDTVFLCIVSMRHGYTYYELLEYIKNGIAQCIPVMFIFLLIGCITASWILSGTVPAIIYYGLKVIAPSIFLPIGLIICSFTSLAIGTAWGTVSTVGIALIGMGYSLGIPAPLTAGMVISGSFFGDKMSPISDTAALASTSAGSDLYKHLKSMFMTSGPSFVIALIVFWVVGLKYSKGGLDQELINSVLTALKANFNLNPIIVMLPMIVLFALNIKQVPAIPSMLAGIATGALVGVFYQGISIFDVFNALNYGFVSQTGYELVDSLLSRGGIQDMMWTFSLAFIALSLGGVLDRVGYMKILILDAIENVQNAGVLSVIVIVVTFLGTVTMGEVYLSLVLSGNLFKEAFNKKGYRPELLSRYVEEGGTIMQVFIPWSTSGSFLSGTLGISTLAYSPYVILNIVNPVISIIFSFLGIAVLRKKPEEPMENVNVKIESK